MLALTKFTVVRHQVYSPKIASVVDYTETSIAASSRTVHIPAFTAKYGRQVPRSIITAQIYAGIRKLGADRLIHVEFGAESFTNPAIYANISDLDIAVAEVTGARVQFTLRSMLPYWVTEHQMAHVVIGATVPTIKLIIDEHDRNFANSLRKLVRHHRVTGAPVAAVCKGPAAEMAASHGIPVVEL